MPYKPTGRPNGRPPRYPVAMTIQQLEAKAASLREQARRREGAADEAIAKMRATGQTRQQVADLIGKTVSHVRVAENRYRRKAAERTP